MLKIGLTGGIASGKSTASNYFIGQGVEVIDADIIARQVVEPGKPALHEIKQAFGAKVLAADGSLNRQILRALVFADDSLRVKLEKILHPRIREEMFRRINNASDTPYLIVAVPLLVEGNLHHQLDRILVIDVDQETQIQRLRKRDGMTREQCLKILSVQISRENRLAAADDIVDNSGDLQTLHGQLEQIHKKYLRLAENMTKEGTAPIDL